MDGAAGGHVPGAGDLLQLIDLVGDHRHIDVAEGFAADGLDAVLSQVPVHVDKVPGHVPVFLLVHRPVGPDEVPGPGIGQKVLQDRLVPPVHILLGGLGDIDVAEAAGGPGGAKQGIQDKGVTPMVIPAPVPVVLFVFRGKKHRVSYEFTVVEDRFSPLALFVVPVDDRAFVCRVYPVIVDVPVSLLCRPGELPLQLGVALQQQVVVPQPQVKHIPRLLDVRDPALPVEVQDVDPPDADVPQALQLFRIPEDTVDAGAGFQLVVHDPVIGVLKILLLQDHRQDGPQGLGLFPVPLLPGQHIGAGIVVHGLGVLVGNGVEEPAGGRLHLAARTSSDAFPVPQPVPLLIFDDPPLQVGLALPVAVQVLPGPAEPVRAYWRFILH